MARTNIEWVAQVSLLRPGCSGRTDFSGETQVSKARPGPPTQSLEVAACFSTERSVVRNPRFFSPVLTQPIRAVTCTGLREGNHKLEFVRVIALFLWRGHRLAACPSPLKSNIDRTFADWSRTMTNASMNRDQMARQELNSVIIKINVQAAFQRQKHLVRIR